MCIRIYIRIYIYAVIVLMTNALYIPCSSSVKGLDLLEKLVPPDSNRSKDIVVLIEH